MLKKDHIDESLIRSLAALLEETGLTEIEIVHDDDKIRVARQPAAAVPLAGAAFAAVGRPAAKGPPETAEPGGFDGDPANHPGVVKSPMVGTAYRSAEPGARPFTDVGETVTEGQTILIVEAMKTMNQIVAPRAGKVTLILVDDGQPVEYGEPLAIIE
jgi:acetyl-CoA carboxylase biotin carboxyl carrier protein